MQWIDRYVSLISVAIAAVAIALSFYTVVQAKKQQRIDAFFKAQDALMRSDVQDGRTILYEARSRGNLQEDSDTMAAVFRSLATFNSVASLVYRGVIPRSWILDYWHHHLRELQAGYDMTVESRASWRPNPWPELDRLIQEAATYHCVTCPPQPTVAASINPKDAASLEGGINEGLTKAQ